MQNYGVDRLPSTVPPKHGHAHPRLAG